MATQNNIKQIPSLLDLAHFYGNASTKSRRIRTPFGYAMSKPMVNGNSKLARNVLIFDLPAITTCLNCQDCKGKCYAMKAQRQYPGTRAKRFTNYYLAQLNPGVLELILDEQLARSRKPYVRIHSSGDFFSQNYLDMWARLAAKHTEKTFYFYTKVDGILDFSAMLALHNVNRVKSILPNGHINFAPREIILPMAKALNVPVCPYGMDPSNKAPVHCGKSCTLCMKSEYVAFIEH